MYISGHIAPGHPATFIASYYPQYNHQLISLLKRFGDVITATFFGHEHLDHLEVLLDEQGELLLWLPTPLTLVCEGSPIIPLLVHQSTYLASSSITPAGSVHKSRGDSVVRMWVQLKRWCVWVFQWGCSGDGCDLASTLCKYDSRKIDLFVLSDAGKSLFRAANVWWRLCAVFCYCLLWLNA